MFSNIYIYIYIDRISRVSVGEAMDYCCSCCPECGKNKAWRRRHAHKYAHNFRTIGFHVPPLLAQLLEDIQTAAGGAVTASEDVVVREDTVVAREATNLQQKERDGDNPGNREDDDRADDTTGGIPVQISSTNLVGATDNATSHETITRDPTPATLALTKDAEGDDEGRPPKRWFSRKKTR